jgi:hypothetical protein
MEIPIIPIGPSPRTPEAVQIESLEITPYPDRRRIHIRLKITPFLQRPNVLIVAQHESGINVGELNIIETLHFDMEFTLHIRNLQETTGTYTLTADVFYKSRNPPQDRRVIQFVIPARDS